MALGDLMASRFSTSSFVVSNQSGGGLSRQESLDAEIYRLRDIPETASTSGDGNINGYSSMSGAPDIATGTVVYLPQTIVLCELRHEAFEDSVPTGPAESGPVSKWRPKERVSFFSCLLGYFCCLVIVSSFFFAK